MAQSLRQKRQKTIDRLNYVSKQAEAERHKYSKYRNEGNKSLASFHRKKQIRWEKILFTAESRIDSLNDKLGIERGNYK